MKPILEIQNISKKFRIGGDRGGYKTLRDSLFSRGPKQENKGEFWALQDVSFDVFPGDTIGIIGKNGAGKSTLLKILSRITPPTKGKIICRGRIASLLEVGTGFHGELSGRENIYLNGSILGLKRTEINNKFDEIVDFSGVEKFLDTPLKHYSSGMQLRLAFAVAAHLEPEILIIDEVLAVGDAEFQKKCLGKMDEISKQQGRTILFVSHNLSIIKQMCSKTAFLKEGILKSLGESTKIVDEYLSVITNVSNHYHIDLSGKNLEYIAEFIDIRFEDESGNLIKQNKPYSEWQIKLRFKIVNEIPHFILAVKILNMEDIEINTNWSKPELYSKGIYEITFYNNSLFLTSGKYKFNIGFSSHEHTFFELKNEVFFEVEDIIFKDIFVNNKSGFLLNQCRTKTVKTDVL